MVEWIRCKPGEALPIAEIPCCGIDELERRILKGCAQDARLLFLSGQRLDDRVRLWAGLAEDEEGTILLCRSEDASRDWRSLVEPLPEIHLFERELAEDFGFAVDGHPWDKPVRRNLAKDFFHVEGPAVHEVAVGPVHAGVIEPGHFRFQCAGEEVLHLEASFGYQHRGILPLFRDASPAKRLALSETVSGDATIAHATAWCLLNETFSGQEAPLRACVLRAVALELERLACHVGDLGALAGDAGYLPTASFCGRLRGDLLNATAMLCGNRFGRGVLVPGGVKADLADAGRMRSHLDAVRRDVEGALRLLFESASTMARFEDVGILSGEDARSLGLVGVAARASGLARDARICHADKAFQSHPMPLILEASGDVLARAQVRRREIEVSFDWIGQELSSLPDGPIHTSLPTATENAFAVSLCEGWRGEVVHLACTDGSGHIDWWKPVDPSFRNWNGLALSLRGGQISDFPLCNKSFNLSYCGFDL
jgi:Ni,Fe-hydrogenase III large subunit